MTPDSEARKGPCGALGACARAEIEWRPRCPAPGPGSLLSAPLLMWSQGRQLARGVSRACASTPGRRAELTEGPSLWARRMRRDYWTMSRLVDSSEAAAWRAGTSNTLPCAGARDAMAARPDVLEPGAQEYRGRCAIIPSGCGARCIPQGVREPRSEAAQTHGGRSPGTLRPGHRLGTGASGA